MALLNYLLDGRITNQEIYQALKVSSSTYYRRIRQDDYPNADELHKIADRFHLSFTDLQVRLGFITREDVEGYVGAQRLSVPAAPRAEAHVAI
jgi:hypothetical protein